MGDEGRLLEMRGLAEDYLAQSEGILRGFVPEKLLPVFENWLTQRRLMDPAIFINRAMCDLEGRIFGDHELKVSVLAGSAAAIADDVLDSKQGTDYSNLFLFGDHKETGERRELNLFYALNQGLMSVLPVDFRSRFGRAIMEYNRAQQDSINLFNSEITLEGITDIKDRAGGYSILLLHAMVFPDETVGVTNPNYQKRPTTKQEALYDYGAWLSRVDDLWDIRSDSSKRMRQLATEGIVSWDSLPMETERMKAGLNNYYLSRRVQEMIVKHYSPLLDRKIFEKYGGNK